MKVSDLIARYLKTKGVKTVFGYQGGSITHIIDSISKCDGIQYIQSYHEQGASFCADAYARLSEEELGVAIGTNGPGATNLVTGIANAYCDSIPVLFITGQVQSYLLEDNRKYRQNGFQEIDIVSIVRPITKFSVTVKDENDVIPSLKKAIEISQEGRRGPVLVDIPVDIQGADVDIDIDQIVDDSELESSLELDRSAFTQSLDSVLMLLNNSTRPLLLCGGGCDIESKNDLKDISDKYSIPIVSSLMGLDKVSHTNEKFLGLIGTYGNRYANLAVQRCDLLIVLGSRLDQRQTGKNTKEFARNARIVHIDIDPLELCHSVDEDISVNCECSLFIKHLKDKLDSVELDYSSWFEEVKKLKSMYPAEKEVKESGTNPTVFFRNLGLALPENSVICCDVGQNQMWVAQALRLKTDRFRILNSGGLGAMGYALPSSIGAYFAQTCSKCIAIMGDGGMQMNIQELNMIRTLSLPIMLIIVNNHSLGMIRDIQQKYYNCNYEGTLKGYRAAPVKRIAEAYEIDYIHVRYDVEEEIIRDLVGFEGPMIVEVDMEPNTYVAPELTGLNPLDRQDPVICLSE